MTKKKKTGISRFLHGIKILHEDRDIIVIDKPAGMLTMGARGENQLNAQGVLTNYIRKGNSKSRKPVHIVHRLDRDTSGVLIFALTREAQDNLRNNWVDVKKKYLAVVHGTMEKKSGTIVSYLAENKALYVYSTKDTSEGKLSHTAYKVCKETKLYSLLEIDLQTGRKNQIRVHMTEAGHPIIGDKKYGKGLKKFKRMALHAKSISFYHPFTNKWVSFETRTPEIFSALTRGTDKAARKNNSTPDSKSGAPRTEKNNTP